MKHKRGVLLIAGIGATVGLALAGGGTIYAAHLENRDTFCASCHTEPESAYVQRARASAATDLATRHRLEGVRCIDCHSGRGLTGRLDGMTTGAGDLLHYELGNYHDPAITTDPLDDSYCLKCHADVATARTFENHFHLLLGDWQQRDPRHAGTCIECHQSHVLGGLAEAGFLQQQPTVAVCNRCHGFVGQG